MNMRSNNNNVDDEARQHQQRRKISTVEAAATTVLTVLRKYTTEPSSSSLPSTLNPDDIILTTDSDIGMKSWEIHKSSPWYNMSEAFDEISMAREGLVKAWASTTTMMMKTSNKDGDEYNKSHSCYWNSKSRDAGSSEGGQQRRRRTQQIDGLNNMVDGSNNLDDDNNDGEGDDGWWQSIIPLAANDTVAKTPRTTIDNNQFVNVNKNDNNKMVPLTQDEQRTFDTVHLEYTTAIFGDELDAIRQGKLEEYFITKKKYKASSSSSQKEANNTKDKTVIKNAYGDVELDHTHYSFVVPLFVQNKHKIILNRIIGFIACLCT